MKHAQPVSPPAFPSMPAQCAGIDSMNQVCPVRDQCLRYLRRFVYEANRQITVSSCRYSGNTVFLITPDSDEGTEFDRQLTALLRVHNTPDKI